MKPPELAPRQQLDLRIATRDGLHALRTHLEWSEARSGRLCVDWPTPGSRLFPLHAGQAITVELSRPGEGLYALETLLESASTEEPPYLVLRPLGEWQHLERRESLRHPVDIHPSTALRLREAGAPEPFVASMGDLSSGGLRLRTATELQPGERIELTFVTPSGGAELRTRVCVVRVTPTRHAGRAAFEVGCQFVEPSAAEREQIVHFILAQQAALLRSSA